MGASHSDSCPQGVRRRPLGACSKRQTLARGNVTPCIRDTSRAVSNAVCSFQCRRKPFGLLPQGMRLRLPCRRLDKLDAALELRHGIETAASCIMMQSMTIPLAVRLSNLTFPSRLLEKLIGSLRQAPNYTIPILLNIAEAARYYLIPGLIMLMLPMPNGSRAYFSVYLPKSTKVCGPMN